MFNNIIRAKNWNFFLLPGLSLLFLFSPFYAQPNLGGTGLDLTYNIPIWGVASWIIIAGILLSVISAQFNYPQLWFNCVAFPFIVIISGVLVGASQPIDWLFRQLYIFGGMLFLFALFQFRPNQKTVDFVLFMLVLATGLHALLGTMQIVAPSYLSSYFPPNNGFTPQGMFQQINVQASFLATGLVISLYFISRPNFRFTSCTVKSVVVIAFTLAIYVVVASGSRIGLLSLFIAMPLVILSRLRQLKPHKILMIILLMASCGSFIAGQTGLDKTLDKTVQLIENSYSTARVAIYTIGMELVVKEPLRGYGIGGFHKAWNLQSSDFVSRHPESTLPQYLSHPHNEILFWMIEAGLPALVGIIVFVSGICLALYQCGFQRGGAYAAMLLPISLHTQVELPFYISSLHWFIWLFLIYLVLRHHTKTVTLNLSLAMTRLIQIVSVGFAVGLTLFMINTARAQADLYDFAYNKNAQAPYLQVALNNLYTKPYAEQLAMRSMLYTNIEKHDQNKVAEFESWALDYVATRPELKMYEDLISASVFLRPEGKGCDAIAAGLIMYSHNKPLQLAFENCKKQIKGSRL